MSEWPKDVVDFTPYATLSTGDENCPVADFLSATSIAFTGAGGWPTANLAIYIPVLVRMPTMVYQMAWGNGATLGSNVDVGIYDGASKARLVSTGSTAQSGSAALQAVDVTDTLIPPGLHYLAMAMDTVSPGQINRASLTNGAAVRLSGAAQQALAFPLPSTATLAAFATTITPLVVAAIEGGVF